MSPALRVRLAVGAAAVAAAAVVVGVVLATRQDPPQPRAQCAHAPSAVLVPGVGDAETNAAVKASLADWPSGTLKRLGALAQQHRGNPVVLLNYALVLECRGYFNDAVQVLQAAKRAGRDTQYEIDADQLLHPQYFQSGYPIFEPTSNDPLLVRGALLQREGHQHSAERLYAKAARLHPNDPEALTAAAVGRFDESNLSASFSRLGPLAKRFPRSQTVRYHLGLMLVWIGQAKQGVTEFELARKLGPKTTLGREATQLLDRIQAGTTTSRK